MSFRVICCICGQHLSGDPQGTTISHSYCLPCVRERYPEYADVFKARVEPSAVVTTKLTKTNYEN